MIVVNLSGRGDKDLATVARPLERARLSGRGIEVASPR